MDRAAAARDTAGLAPPDYTLRDARPEDASVLAEAERSIADRPGFLVSQPWEIDERNFAAKIAALTGSPNGKYLVAERNGDRALLGHAFLDPLPHAATRHVVQLTIVVHPGHERRGIGRALLTALMEWARGSPVVEKIERRVRSSNTAAQRLYRSKGFTEEGTLKHRVKIAGGEYLDDVMMALWVV